jgi:hypothetical protein
MMMTFIFSLFIWSFESKSVYLAQSQSPPNKEYMNVFIHSYLQWHEMKFNYRPKLKTLRENEFLQKLILEISHWKTPEYPQLDQILIGQGFHGENPFYVFRIYVQKSLRKDPYLANFKFSDQVIFIESLPTGEICFLIPGKEKWKTVPEIEDGTYFKHYCQDKTNAKIVLKFISIQTEKPNDQILNPFRGMTEYELRRYSETGISDALYFTKNALHLMIPKKHYKYINSTGVETLLPFDKYSVDKNGDIIIYYP